MALSESALKNLHKDEIISFALDHQSKFDSTLSGIRNELSDLKKYCEQLRPDLSITKLMNTMLKEKVEYKDMERTVLGIFEKLDAMVDPSNVEDYHWIKSSKGPKKVIVKLSRRKDTNKIHLLKKGLKGMNLSSLGIDTMVYIDDSLCTYHKMLWGKCRKILLKKYIHSFWVTNGAIKLNDVQSQ